MLCPLCGRFSDDILCPDCLSHLESLSFAQLYPNRCPRCNRPVVDEAYPCLFCLNAFQAYGTYTGLLAELLLLYKIGGQRSLKKVLASLYVPLLEPLGKVVLIPIPASRNGLKRRGFDQMGLVCRYLKRSRGYGMLSLFVQTGVGQNKFLSRHERHERHPLTLIPKKGAEIARYQKEGYSFVIIDDVSTTGFTLQVARDLLAKAYGIDPFSLVLALA
ncbi:hypothetical protein [Sphaerochaeta sp. PS]|uniref:ComF family protein n=1 Tax=Sphaerochaeta sp. PS TaxID=3076336 RepID=UPI0028A37120|nr:hypothetical protein [Sphaerochaeta sp. PS]MDT4761485.1 hypothetical protein [Sphaerochaeta sp. PS]